MASFPDPYFPISRTPRPSPADDRGCDGYAGAYSATGGLLIGAPGDPAGSPRGAIAGSQGPHGPGGCLSAPASAILGVAANLRPFGPCAPVGRSPAPCHCWPVTDNGHSEPPGSRDIRSPSRRRSRPHETVNGAIHVPSQAATSRLSHAPESAGISAAKRARYPRIEIGSDPSSLPFQIILNRRREGA